MTGFVVAFDTKAFDLGEAFIGGLAKLEVPDKHNPKIILKVNRVAMTKQRPDGITYADWAVNQARAHGLKVFWDGKESDISNTVHDTILNIAEKGNICMATFMMSVSSKTLKEISLTCRLHHILSLGVTALTDMNNDDCRAVFRTRSALEAVRRAADRAYRHVIGGVVCSGQELPLRHDDGSFYTDIATVATGIRCETLPSVENDDQARPISPAEAVRRVADYIVVGRQVINHPDPILAAQTIIDEMAAASR